MVALHGRIKDKIFFLLIFIVEYFAMLEELIKALKNHYYAPVSYELGTNVQNIVTRMPESHRLWDELALNLPDYIATFRVKNILENMPVLDADENSLPKEYLLRASIIVSGFAHAYFYPNGCTENDSLPAAIKQPLEQIAKRINKKFNSENKDSLDVYVGRTYLEDFLANWQFKEDSLNTQKFRLQDIEIDALKLQAPYFDNQEELVSTLVTGPLMQAHFAPAIEQLRNLERELNQASPSISVIINTMKNISAIVLDVRNTFMLMSPKLKSKYYVDQVIWPKTSPTIGKKIHPNEAPNTGADSPIFHILDKLIAREEYDSKMGKNIQSRFGFLVENHQKLILAVEKIGQQLFQFVKDNHHKDLRDAYATLVSSYTGRNSLLESHRKKAFGYLKMSFLGGRLATNGNERGSSSTKENQQTGLTPWGGLHYSFVKGMDDRKKTLRKLGIDIEEKAKEKMIDYPNQNTFYKRHEIARSNASGRILGIFENMVFDLTAIAETHPGGHRLIKSLAGSDMTVELNQAHFYDIENIKLLMKKYCIGQLKEPLIKDELKVVINKWTRVLFMISEIQNNLQNIWFFDQKQVGDRQRQVPFHFVMKTLNILFGHEGYLDSLLSIIDDDLLVLYRNKELKHFKSPLKKPEYVHKFTDIGQLAIEYGQDEIQHFDIQTADETLVNKLIVAKL
ncbi:cytochrome b5 domain-containing protein, partial [Legionella drancourtii]|uniref:cytochrome b5 domain-containing protein n=1 Tax=Legionella drancourtii TaxID=168933 RepID=UPI0011D22CE1